MGSGRESASGAKAARAATAGRWALALAITGSALAVGAVHTVTLAIVIAVLVAATAMTWSSAEPMFSRSSATLILLTGVALTTFTALQCLPVPTGWLAVAAPHNADVWLRALQPLRETGPKWAPLSLDPTATHVEVAKGVAYLLCFIAAVNVARNRDGVGFLGAVVVVTGILLAVSALLHPAFGARHLFGVYEPGAISERHVAPLINPNNLAGYLNIALCLALAGALAPQTRVPRVIAVATVLLLGATQVWVASRGGVLTMILGIVIVLGLSYAGRTRRSLTLVSVAVSGAAALGALLVVLGTSQSATDELFESDASKLTSTWHMLRMLPSMPWFGCGRGAFESAFSAFRSDPGYVSYVYPENFAVQWVLEWGAPVGVLAIATLAFALRPSSVFARSTTAVGAWAALAALTAQNFADLGTNTPGLMLAAVTCAAIVTGGTPGRRLTWRVGRWARRPTAVVVGTTLAGAVGVVLAWSALGVELREDEDALHAAATGNRLALQDIHALARQAMLRHPGEPYLPFVVAVRAAAVRDESPLPWIDATLERAHVYGPAHLLLGRLLRSRSPAQARMEARLAIEQMPEHASAVMEFAPSLVEGYDDALEIVPEGKSGPSVIGVMIDRVASRLPATAARLNDELLMRAPGDVDASLRRARDCVVDVEPERLAPWCEGPRLQICLQQARQAASRAESLAPARCEPHALMARIRIAAGEVVRALDELETQADEVTERVKCLETLETLATAVSDDGRAQHVLGKIAVAGCSSNDECAQQLTWVAQEQERRGNLREALGLCREAHERMPDDDALLENVARLAAASGLHAEAAEGYNELARRRPLEAKWHAAATAEWTAAMHGASGL